MTSHEPIEATEKLFTRTRSRSYRGWVRFGGCCFIFCAFLVSSYFHGFDRFENMALDLFQRCAPGKQGVDPRIAVIEISKSAIDEIGEWPWPRRYYAVIARLLDQWGAKAIVFDINFQGTTVPKDDQDLAQALEKITVPFYLPVDLKPVKQRRFWVHGLPVTLDKDEGKLAWVHSLPEFEAKAKAIGHHEFSPDADGVLRRFAPFLAESGNTFPFLALATGYDLMSKKIPERSAWQWAADRDGRVLIPWVQDWRQAFPRYDFAALIHSFYSVQQGLKPVISPEALQGKICIIGLASKELAEFRVTPLGDSCPPPGIIANIMNGVLSNNWIRIVPDLTNALVLIAIGIIAALLLLAFRSSATLLAGLFLGILWVFFCFFVFWKFRVWFAVVQPLLLVLVLFIFTSVYEQLASMRERSVLFRLATRDGLTDLYVIRHFRLIMNQIVPEANLRRLPLSIILLDIDHFKKVNDTYGHPAGDMVLKKVAQTIETHIRRKRAFAQVDFAARYGGEEFIVILRKAELEEAAQGVAERLRKAIESLKFEWDGKPFSVTASLGVATIHPGENIPDPMVRRADAALYRAKEGGRNQVRTEKN